MHPLLHPMLKGSSDITAVNQRRLLWRVMCRKKQGSWLSETPWSYAEDICMFILDVAQAVEFGIYIIIPGDCDSRSENKADSYAVLNSSLEVLATQQPTVSQKSGLWGDWITKETEDDGIWHAALSAPPPYSGKIRGWRIPTLQGMKLRLRRGCCSEDKKACIPTINPVNVRSWHEMILSMYKS